MPVNIKVIAVFASSLDGRLGPAGATRFVRISSDADTEHLLRVRDLADAVLMGGITFQHYPKPHFGLERADLPLHCIITSGKRLTFNEPLFQQSPSLPVIIFSPNHPCQDLPADVDWHHISALKQTDGQAVPKILDLLEGRKIKTLLVEGGGQVFRQFLLAKAVDELYLTIVPRLIGDKSSPRLTGSGSFLPKPFPHTKLLNSWQIGQEWFCHFLLRY